MPSIKSSWTTIEGVLKENANSVYRALRGPISASQLKRLGSLPDAIPHDLVASLKIHDGLRNSYLGQVRLYNYWALLPAEDMLREWTAMRDLQEECGFGGVQFKVSTRFKNDKHWRPGWLPFMDADGDKVVIDLDPGPKGKSGQLFQWSNSGSFAPRLLADSLGDWLSQLAETLSKRAFHLDEFGGIVIDGSSCNNGIDKA